MLNERILFVDDEPTLHEQYRRALHQAITMNTANDGETGLRVLTESGPYAIVIVGMDMPGMNGIDFLVKARAVQQDLVCMMLTGNPNLDVAVKAINEGKVFRYLTKPCPPEALARAILDGIRQYRLQRAERELIEGTLDATVELLAEILSATDPVAFGRTIQIRRLMHILAQALDLDDRWEIELAATLSQIGYVTIPRDLILKVQAGKPLAYDELVMIESIPQIGHDLLERIPRLENVAKAVLYQNKRYDGEGPPKDGVAGAALPIAARMLKVVLDLLELENHGLGLRDALKAMRRRDHWYDPKVLYTATDVFKHDERGLFGQELPPLPLPLSELHPGLTLASDIATTAGQLLVRRGTQLSETQLLRIKRFAAVTGVHEPVFVRPRHPSA